MPPLVFKHDMCCFCIFASFFLTIEIIQDSMRRGNVCLEDGIFPRSVKEEKNIFFSFSRSLGKRVAENIRIIFGIH